MGHGRNTRNDQQKAPKEVLVGVLVITPTIPIEILELLITMLCLGYWRPRMYCADLQHWIIVKSRLGRWITSL